MTVEEMASLKRLTWATLQRKALDAGVELDRVREVATRDELRLAIIEATVAREADGE